MKTQNHTSTHPLILIAAVSVSVASLAAAAHFTGLLPARSEAAPPPVLAAAAPPVAPIASAPAPVAAAPAPAPKVIVVRVPESRPAAQAVREVSEARRDSDFRRVSSTPREDNGIDVYPARPAATTLPPAPPPQATQQICHDCGTVESVREVAAQSAVPNVGLGAIAGGILGGLLGNQTGGGNGKKAMTVVGALGGAYAGHQVEKHLRGEQQYEVSVRFDDGSYRTYTQTSGQWRSGDRVRLTNGQLAVL
mgnify:CR=1 FL=1